MQRRRLLRMGRRAAETFDSPSRGEAPKDNLLSRIGNQNLFLKLVGMTLQLSEEAGLPRSEIQALETKLLSSKNLQHYSTRTQESKNSTSTNPRLHSPDLEKAATLAHSDDYASFLQAIQRQFEDSQAKHHIIFALKKYIALKKKTLSCDFIRREATTRAKRFQDRIVATRFQPRVRNIDSNSLSVRNILGRVNASPSQSYQIIREYSFLMSMMGHSFFKESEEEYCPVFNVIFDATEKLIITAGEDGTIKVWMRDNGALLSSLRGHKEFINKICISSNNQYILSSAGDGVRFFDLATMTSMGGYDTENIMDIGEVVEGPPNSSSIIFADARHLYLLEEKEMLAHRNRKLELHNFSVFNFSSSIQDVEGQVCNVLLINPQNVIFLGFISGEIIITSFSNFRQASETGVMLGDDIKSPEFKLPVDYVLKAHEGDIVEIKWNPMLQLFCTGSKKDGVCKVWQMKSEDTQRPIVLRELRIPKLKVKRKKKNFACNFVCWNCTYTHMACSFIEEDLQEDDESRGDGDVIIYNALREEITWEMGRTIDLASIKCMDSHPIFPNVMLICDGNGKILLADIYENIILNIFEERAFHLLYPEFCLSPSECRFSQDGMTFVVGTDYGNVSLYGYDLNDFYHIYPTEQFFESDHQSFQIDQVTYHPIESFDNPIDINSVHRGVLQNIRRQSYLNLAPLDTQTMLQNIQSRPKIVHRNSWRLASEDKERIVKNYLEHERSLEVFKKNLEDLENKRLAILYGEQECRQEKFEEILQEKINLIKETENLTLAPAQPGIIPVSHSDSVPVNRPIPTRRRTRQPNPSNSYAANDQPFAEESQPIEDEGNFEEYQAEPEEEAEIESDGDDFNDNSSSEIIYPQRRRDRTRRRQQERQRAARQFGEAPRTRRRNPQEDIESLENGYEEYQKISKRVKKDDDNEQVSDGEGDMIHRVVRRRHNPQQYEPKQKCLDCQNECKVTCETCLKKYCEGCRVSRGKRFQNKPFECFDCIFQKNQAPEVHRHISQGSYQQTERGDIYIPQIGDEVAYFFQGYEEFVSDKIQVLNNRFIFEGFDIKRVLPHLEHPELYELQKLTVSEIHFAFPLEEASQFSNSYKRGRTRLPNRAASSDAQMFIGLKNENILFYIYFLPGYEFILNWEVKEDIFQQSRYDKFELFDMASIKEESVQIMEVRPLSLAYPTSIWKNIVVHKGQSKNLRHKDKSQDIAVNIWNINGFVNAASFKYQSKMPLHLQNQYSTQVSRIEQVDPEAWEFFYNFVDTDLFPSYYEYVEVGMCLLLIIERLQNSYYQTEASFVQDIHHIVDNAVKFNGQDSYVANLAKKMSSMIIQGENYNPANEASKEAEKKAGSRKRGTNSSPKNSEPHDDREKKRVHISEFQDEDLSERRNTRNLRNRKVIDSDEEDNEDDSAEEKYNQTRNKSGYSSRLRVRQNGNRSIAREEEDNHAPSRVTRSRAKHT